MTFTESERRTVDEAYLTASNTSDLSVDADRIQPVDTVIAAGWSPTRIGMAAMRLHSEWDAAEKPRSPTREAVQALIGTNQALLPGDKPPAPGQKLQPLTSGQAHRYAAAWHAHELGILFGKLKTLPAVREQVTIQALIWGMEVPEAKVASVLRHWLAPACPVCNGLRWQSVEGSPALSGKTCPAPRDHGKGGCGGTGVAPIPFGADGKRLSVFLDDCVNRARQSMRNRLRPGNR